MVLRLDRSGGDVVEGIDQSISPLMSFEFECCKVLGNHQVGIIRTEDDTVVEEVNKAREVVVAVLKHEWWVRNAKSLAGSFVKGDAEARTFLFLHCVKQSLEPRGSLR
jgi:hypothetical protein